jgi:hypothetical protein
MCCESVARVLSPITPSVLAYAAPRIRGPIGATRAGSDSGTLYPARAHCTRRGSCHRSPRPCSLSLRADRGPHRCYPRLMWECLDCSAATSAARYQLSAREDRSQGAIEVRPLIIPRCSTTCTCTRARTARAGVPPFLRSKWPYDSTSAARYRLSAREERS